MTINPPLVNPNLAATRAITDGVQWNERGWECLRQGDYESAAACHRRALEMKLAGLGENHASTAISYNALGEALTKLNELDEAEEYIKKAIRIALEFNSAYDQAYYRENLAVIHEMRGNLALASKIRALGKPDKVVCAHYHVSDF